MVFLVLLNLFLTHLYASECLNGSQGVEIEIVMEDEPYKILGQTKGGLLLEDEKMVLKIKQKEHSLHLLSMSETIYDSSISVSTRLKMRPETLIAIIKQTLNKKQIQDKAVVYNLNEIKSHANYFLRNPLIDLSSHDFYSPTYTEDDTLDVFYPAKPHGTYEEPYLVVKFNFSKNIHCYEAR